jgi:Short C-terminal domain
MPRRRGRAGLLGTVGKTAVVAGTATAVTGGMRRRAAQRQAAAGPPQEAPTTEAAARPPEVPQDSAATAAPPPTPAAGPAMSTDDKISQIRQLGELKDQGLLTEEEFAAEKRKILAS